MGVCAQNAALRAIILYDGNYDYVYLLQTAGSL